MPYPSKGGHDAVALALQEGSRTVREICDAVDVIGRHQVQRILNRMLADGLVTFDVRPAGETNAATRFFRLMNQREVSLQK